MFLLTCCFRRRRPTGLRQQKGGAERTVSCDLQCNRYTVVDCMLLDASVVRHNFLSGESQENF